MAYSKSWKRWRPVSNFQ